MKCLIGISRLQIATFTSKNISKKASIAIEPLEIGFFSSRILLRIELLSIFLVDSLEAKSVEYSIRLCFEIDQRSIHVSSRHQILWWIHADVSSPVD